MERHAAQAFTARDRVQHLPVHDVAERRLAGDGRSAAFAARLA